MRVTSILLAIAALSVSPARSADRKPLTVRVVAYVPVPAATLRAITVRGEEIFRAAGFQTLWDACTPARHDCAELSDGEILLKIVRRAPSYMRVPAFGSIIRDQHTAYFGWIFYERIARAAKANETPPSLLLAHVMAHEVAHVLGVAHSDHGIMHCQFTGPEIQQCRTGGLRFTPEQAAELRAAATARQNPSIASTSYPLNPEF